MPTRKSKKAQSKKTPAKRSRKVKSAPRHRPSTRPASLSRYTHARSGVPNIIPDRAHKDMPRSILEIMARRRGIPFGGLNKTKLIHKINTY